MKNLIRAAALLTFLVYGCSEQNNPVASSPASDVASVAAPTKICITRSMDQGGAMCETWDIISTSGRILAKNGGCVSLKGTYLGSGGRFVSYDLSVNFLPGALTKDTTITITLNKIAFQENGLVTFGPCGLVFNSPGILNLKAQGITVAQYTTSVKLYYLNNGVFEQMPSSWGSYVSKNFGQLQAGAKIPHFSRYAFGR